MLYNYLPFSTTIHLLHPASSAISDSSLICMQPAHLHVSSLSLIHPIYYTFANLLLLTSSVLSTITYSSRHLFTINLCSLPPTRSLTIPPTHCVLLSLLAHFHFLISFGSTQTLNHSSTAKKKTVQFWSSLSYFNLLSPIIELSSMLG